MPRRRNIRRRMGMVLITWCLAIAGCADDVRLPSTQQLAEFHRTGPAGPAVDLAKITQAQLDTGPYLVRAEEVLELTMPTVLQIVTAEASKPSAEMAPYICRISEAGTISLPAVGEIHVVGKSTAQIEATVAAAYFPRFTTTRPSIYVRVLEHRTHRVSIVGAVKEPGLYDLRADKMSLVALLMEAKGITEDGAAVIRIAHADRPAAADGSGRGAQPFFSGTTGGGGLAVSPARDGNSPSGSDLALPTDTPAMPVRLQFEWTGPLHTSGTLAMHRGSTLLTRKWLDIGVPMQRQNCLDAVRREIAASDAADLEGEISMLADWLGGRPRPSQDTVQAPPSPWCTADGVHFETAIMQSPGRITAGREYATTSPMIAPAMLRQTAPLPEKDSQVVLLPVRGLNIPFADVALREGDTVVVEPLVVCFVSVLGLVGHPGHFEYPPGTTYNLGQVIALAGGLDRIADPRYATIYRLEADGSIAHAVFEIQGGRHKGELTEAFSVPVKPGDIIAVEQTPRTRSNQFIDRVLRFNIGTYVSTDRLWD